MAFISTNWLSLPTPSAVFATCQIGLHEEAFYLQCFPTIQQDPSVKKAYCFTFSGSWLCNGDFSAHITSFSGDDIPKHLLSVYSMIISKIPGLLGFLIQACCVISVTHLFHVDLWSEKQTLCLNIQPSTGSQGPERRCASVATTSEASWTPSYAVNNSSVGVYQGLGPLHPGVQNP